MAADAMFAPTDAELVWAIEELHQAQHRIERELRATMRRFSGLTCTCARRFDWGRREPPQLGCIVHGLLVLGHDGTIL